MNIYFMRTSRGHVKIGKTIRVEKRLMEVSVGCPFPVRLIGIIRDSDYHLENTLHTRFASQRMSGEWFWPSYDLGTYIAANAIPMSRHARIWSEVLCKNPDIVHLFGRVFALTSDNNPKFCANRTWYEDGGFKDDLLKIVGWEAGVTTAEQHTPLRDCKIISARELASIMLKENAPEDDFFMGSSAAYDAAYETIYNALPDCRGCGCY